MKYFCAGSCLDEVRKKNDGSFRGSFVMHRAYLVRTVESFFSPFFFLRCTGTVLRPGTDVDTAILLSIFSRETEINFTIVDINL